MLVLIGGLAVASSAPAVVLRMRASADRIHQALGELGGPSEEDEETERRLAELDAESDRPEKAVSELAPGLDLVSFAESRVSDYVEHLGVVSLLRTVLYIDDLDRCPPKVVVQVLEAIHLLPVNLRRELARKDLPGAVHVVPHGRSRVRGARARARRDRGPGLHPGARTRRKGSGHRRSRSGGGGSHSSRGRTGTVVRTVHNRRTTSSLGDLFGGTGLPADAGPVHPNERVSPERN
ncbi:P-loop NTPase fold protein [Amycolatopsis sp. NPDC058340]|uniref:P-loop NTPase fold protein n=1 Tax=Amycolatopsis sp. NPDC058340 TaxID=3346453 RepID=UPI00365EE150